MAGIVGVLSFYRQEVALAANQKVNVSIGGYSAIFISCGALLTNHDCMV